MIRHIWFAALAVLPAFAGPAAISATGDPQGSAKSEPPPLGQTIRVSGVVQFDESKLAQVSSRLPGRSRLDKLLVRSLGEKVRKGEALAELSSPELTVAAQNLLDARRNGNRDLEGVARNRLRLWGLDDEQITNIVRAGKAVSSLILRSPIDGAVIKKHHGEGDYVEEGARLFDVADLSAVWITARIDEDKYARLRKGSSVRAIARPYPDKEFQGTIGFIEPLVEANTRTFGVRCEIPNPHEELRPGMFVTLTILLNGPAGPAEAKDSKLQRLQKERLATLRKLVEQTTRDYQTGRVSFDRVHQAMAAMLRAELELCESDKERIAVLEKIVDQAKEHEKHAAQRYKIGQASSSDALMATADRLEAEIALERMKSKAPDRSK